MIRLPRLLRPPFGPALLLLAAAALAPRDARAACGDYLMIGTAHHAAADSGSPEDHAVPPAPRPCHGPNCSHAPAAPLVPPAPAPTTSTEWACCFTSQIDANVPRCRAAAEPDPARPTLHGDPIFHPPRIAN